MKDGQSEDRRLPLFPLPDVVHFPRTELRLDVRDPRYQRLIRDIVEKDEEARCLGIVLLKPGWDHDGAGRPEIFPGGTAGRVMDAELLPNGCSSVVLHGEFRFELRREILHEPYREGVVHPVAEPWLNERDAGIVAVRGGIVDLLRWLAAELGESFPVAAEEAEQLSKGCAFEELVNCVAAQLDLPPLRKLQLLHETIPERGLSVLSILRSRQRVVGLLRPFCHLSTKSHLN